MISFESSLEQLKDWAAREPDVECEIVFPVKARFVDAKGILALTAYELNIKLELESKGGWINKTYIYKATGRTEDMYGFVKFLSLV